ncbi:uncharacterized protein LOC141635986 [Silene latifolia]|uniref:uncharacterized protein LOC141635986 n=1 Tax=Silene latifolia TaxID=37657 RepID=UPI003D76ED3A
MSDVIPCFSEDIWFEILKNLPVKTLGKCRCVCKSWHFLIVSPFFMGAHLKHYTQNDASSLILCKEITKRSETEEFEQCIFFRDLVQLRQGNRLHTSVCPLDVSFCGPCRFYFVGSVNGLLCISDNGYLRPTQRIFIWNPLIQKSIKLSQSTTDKYSVVGFGYDCRRNDYRVIKISSLCRRKQFLVEVYSIQERRWRIISAKYLIDNSMIKFISASHLFYNGVIHWLIRVNMLLLFNVSDETFAKMELPQGLAKVALSTIGLFEYQGKLSVSYCSLTPHHEFRLSPECQIWVKRDSNYLECSWCKILCIGVGMLPDLCHLGPVEYLGENQELIGFSKVIDGEPGPLVSYNPKTKEIKEFGLRMTRSTKFSAFSESLSLLDQKIDDLTTDELEMSKTA